jgi:hypothetical protein
MNEYYKHVYVFCMNSFLHETSGFHSSEGLDCGCSIMAPYWLIGYYHPFRGTSCLHFRGKSENVSPSHLRILVKTYQRTQCRNQFAKNYDNGDHLKYEYIFAVWCLLFMNHCGSHVKFCMMGYVEENRSQTLRGWVMRSLLVVIY